MPATARRLWSQRLCTAALWALCGVSLAWWGLKLTQPSMQASAPLAAQPTPAVDAQPLARLLGADALPAQGTVA
ncbi:MAG: hypothetical protein WBF97_10045, partial [Comamonas sp.]